LKILLTNDDGFFAPGIVAIAKALAQDKQNSVIIFAPDKERSGFSQSISITKALNVKEEYVEGLEDVTCYSVTGTPADCVRLAAGRLYDGMPDILISGINRGCNVGSDANYSGTVGAAREGAMCGIPSIALSAAVGEANDYSVAVEYGLKAFEYMKNTKLPPLTVLSVNVPLMPKGGIKGIKVTPLAMLNYNNYYREAGDSSSEGYLMPDDYKHELEDGDHDEYWLKNGYVTITPINCDMTDTALLKSIKTEEYFK
jgi:5'-nucleotidase